MLEHGGQGGARGVAAGGAWRPAWRGYALAVASVALAALLTGALQRAVGAENMRVPSALFFAAVLLVSVHGGRAPGLLTVALSALVLAYFFLPSVYSPALGLDGLLQLGVFLSVGLLINHLTLRNKRAEGAARRSEARNSALLHAVPDLMFRISRDGALLDFSGAREYDPRLPPDQFLNRNLRDVLPELAAPNMLHAERALRTGAPQNFEYQLGEDGAAKNFEARIVASGADEVVAIVRDITERRRAEDERARLSARVEDERRRLKDLLASVPGVVWEAWGDPEASAQRINFVSDYVEQMLGYTVEEWLSTPNFWLSIVHPEDRERAAREAHAIFTGGARGVSEFRWVAKDGRVVPVEAQSVAVRDAEGNPLGMRGVTMDISARRQAEEALRASEERYRALAEAMPQIVWTARPDGYFDYYNRRWFDYTGMTLEQTQGWGWQPVLHPEDVERCLRRWARSVETGEDYEIEYRFRRGADGAYRWHLGRAQALRDERGRVVKWFGTSTDIDDQKRTEGALRFLSEADAVLASSLDYEQTLASFARLAVPRLADWCAVDMLREDSSLQRLAVEHVDPSKVELARELEQRYPTAPGDPEGAPKVVRTGRAELYAEITDELLTAAARDAEHLRLLRELGLKSALVLPLAVRGRTLGAITLIMAESDRRYGARDLALAEDLARRAAAAIDNARLYRHTQEANRSKDEFLATLSHELRTPLTPIIGWVQMLRSGRVPLAELPRGLNVIDRNSQELTRLINDLLDMSAIMSGKLRIERAPVVLGAVLEQAAEAARAEAERRGVKLDLELNGCHSNVLAVSGDRTRLLQVFSNLLNNAVKFSAGAARVRASCRPEGGVACVVIEDEGAGIAPGFLPHVFERFRQADSSSTRAHGGLGLGLALVKSFVEAHGGRVAAESAGEGRGSRFTVTLPLLDVARRGGRPDAPEGAATIGAPTAAPAPDVRRVLVVEDARDTLELLQTLFEGRGFAVTLCETAEEALGVASGARFDIIVSDIGLPQIDGYDLIARLRQVPHLRDTPAIALTGYAARRDAEAALRAGFDKHVPKPVDPTALVETVEQLLERKTEQGGDGSP